MELGGCEGLDLIYYGSVVSRNAQEGADMNMMMIGIVTIVVSVIHLVLVACGPSGWVPILSESAMTAMADVLPIVVSLISTAALMGPVRSLKTWDQTKVSWTAILAGIFLCAVAEFLWGLQEVLLGVDMDENWPSFLDVLWLAGYLVVASGLCLLISGYLKSGLGFGQKSFYLVLFLLFGGIAAWVLKYVVFPMAQDEESTLMERMFSIAYPAFDLVILAPALILAYITRQLGGPVARPWRWVAVGLILWTFSDIVFCYLDWNEAYHAGHIIDWGWNLSYLFIAAAAILQRDLLASFAKGVSHGLQ